MNYDYNITRRALAGLLNDMRILSGDCVGPSGATVADVLGTAIANGYALIAHLERARNGKADGFLVFPSPDDCE